MGLPPGLRIVHLAIRDSLGGPCVRLDDWDRETALLATHARLGPEGVKVIEALAADGMTMVMVTHEMGFARGIANRVVFMHRGKVHETGPAAILTSPATPELAKFVGTGL